MALPLQVKTSQQSSERLLPRTVVAVKRVELALIHYTDESGIQQTQLAVVGDNNIHLLSGRTFGISDTTTSQGPASDWLRKAVFEKLEGK